MSELPKPDDMQVAYATMREAAAYLQGVANGMRSGGEEDGETERHEAYSDAIMKGVKVISQLTKMLSETAAELLQVQEKHAGTQAHLEEQRRLLAAATEGGVGAIYNERQRQLNDLGHTVDRDLRQGVGTLAKAAAAYALYGIMPKTSTLNPRALWPWDAEMFTPRDQRTNLERAGALIAAEIDRLDADGS